MNFKDAIRLIQPITIPQDKPVKWADLGCGSGLFTKALASLLPQGSTLYAVDQYAQKLTQQTQNGVSIEFIHANFEHEQLPFSGLDGIFMANSIHYILDKHQLLEDLQLYFRGSGSYLIVEYDTKASNAYVPYPITFDRLKALFGHKGFDTIKKLGEHPSIYGNGNLYAAHIFNQ